MMTTRNWHRFIRRADEYRGAELAVSSWWEPPELVERRRKHRAEVAA
jgi:hypothetical protein